MRWKKGTVRCSQICFLCIYRDKAETDWATAARPLNRYLSPAIFNAYRACNSFNTKLLCGRLTGLALLLPHALSFLFHVVSVMNGPNFSICVSHELFLFKILLKLFGHNNPHVVKRRNFACFDL